MLINKPIVVRMNLFNLFSLASFVVPVHHLAQDFSLIVVKNIQKLMVKQCLGKKARNRNGVVAMEVRVGW